MQWLKFKIFTYGANGLKGLGDYVFPLFSPNTNKRVETAQFTKQVKLAQG